MSLHYKLVADQYLEYDYGPLSVTTISGSNHLNLLYFSLTLLNDWCKISRHLLSQAYTIILQQP